MQYEIRVADYYGNTKKKISAPSTEQAISAYNSIDTLNLPADCQRIVDVSVDLEVGSSDLAAIKSALIQRVESGTDMESARRALAIFDRCLLLEKECQELASEVYHNKG